MFPCLRDPKPRIASPWVLRVDVVEAPVHGVERVLDAENERLGTHDLMGYVEGFPPCRRTIVVSVDLESPVYHHEREKSAALESLRVKRKVRYPSPCGVDSRHHHRRGRTV